MTATNIEPVVYHGITSLYDEKAYRKIYDTLSLEGKEKVDSSQNERLRRQRYIAYGLLSRYGDAYKYHSISHSGRLAYVALADTPVGVDVEEISDKKADRVRRLGQSRFFNESERERLPNADIREFLYLWTMKEAVTKLLGVPLTEVLRKLNYYSIITSDADREWKNFKYENVNIISRQWEEDGGIVTLCWKRAQ